MLKIFYTVWQWIKSFWYGTLSNSEYERDAYIAKLVQNNKHDEIKYRIKNGFNKHDISHLTLLAINNNNTTILALIYDNSSTIFPNLYYNGDNLLIKAFEQSIACFSMLLNIITRNPNPLDDEEQVCITESLDHIVNLESTLDEEKNEDKVQLKNYERFKNRLVKLLPYKHVLLTDELCFEKLIDDLYDIYKEKNKMQNAYRIKITSSDHKTQQVQTLINYILTGVDLNSIKDEIGYLDEKVNFEAVFSNEGYSLLTRVLDKPDVSPGTLKKIVEMNADINHRYIEQNAHSFQSILNIFNNLVLATKNKLDIANKIKEYAKQAFLYQCKTYNIDIDNVKTIQDALAMLKNLPESEVVAAETAYLYYVLANTRNAHDKKLINQLRISLFDGNLVKDVNTFNNLLHMLPYALTLENLDIRQLLRKKEFALKVLQVVLNQCVLSDYQMVMIYRFIKANNATNLSILWSNKFSQKLLDPNQGVNFEAYELDLSDWIQLFSINGHSGNLMAIYDLYLDKYDLYLHQANPIDSDRYNPEVQNEFENKDPMTLLAYAINVGQYQVAKKIVNKMGGDIGNEANEIAKHFYGVKLDKAYEYLNKNGFSTKADEIMLQLIKHYFDIGRASYVKTDLIQIPTLSQDLLRTVYEYLIDTNEDQKEIIDFISKKLLESNIASDLILIDRIAAYNNEAAYDGYKRLLMANMDVNKWSSQHINTFISILANKPYARDMFEKFKNEIGSQSQYNINPLCLESMAGMVTVTNDYFAEITNTVLDEYTCTPITDECVEIKHWLSGLSYIAEDVVQDLLSHKKYLVTLMDGFYTNDENIKYVKAFLKLCNQKNVDFSKVVSGLSLSDLCILEGLAKKDDGLRVYFENYRLKAYIVYLNGQLQKDNFDSDMIEGALRIINNDIKQAASHQLLDLVINGKHEIDQIQSAKLARLIEHLPKSHVMTYIINDENISYLKHLNQDLNCLKVNKMIMFSELSNKLSQHKSIADVMCPWLERPQVEFLWDTIISNLKNNRNYAIKNAVRMIQEYNHHDYFKTLVKDLLTDAPTYFTTNQFTNQFEKFIDSLVVKESTFINVIIKDDNLAVLKSLYEQRSKSSVTNFEKCYLKPVAVAMIKVINSEMDQSTVDYDGLFTLVNKLRLLPIKLIKPLILEQNLLKQIVELELELKGNNLGLMSYMVNALLYAMNDSSAEEYQSILQNSGLTIDQLVDYVSQERARLLFHEDYNTQNIKGHIGLQYSMLDQYKKFFVSTILFVIENGSEKYNQLLEYVCDDTFQWLGFDQISRNILFAQNTNAIEVDYLKLVKTLDNANILAKEDALIIKRIMLENKQQKIAGLMNEPDIKQDKIEMYKAQLHKLEQINAGNIEADLSMEDLPSPELIIQICNQSLAEGQSLQSINAAQIIQALADESEGRKLFVNQDATTMSSYYNKVFNSAIRKYLDIHQSCVNILQEEDVSGVNVEHLRQHELHTNRSLNETYKEYILLSQNVKSLDSLLFIIRFMLTCYNVTFDKLLKNELDLLNKVLNSCGGYNWVKDMQEGEKLSTETIIDNIKYVDNRFFEGMNKIKHAPIIVPRVRRAQSLFKQNNEETGGKKPVRKSTTSLNI